MITIKDLIEKIQADKVLHYHLLIVNLDELFNDDVHIEQLMVLLN